MSRTKENFEAKKQEIIHVAERLFIEKGYKNTTINDLLQATNLSKGGFYHYFNSKEELILSCVQQITDYLLVKADEILSDPSLNVLDKYQKFRDMRNDFLKERRQIVVGLRMIYEAGSYRLQMMDLLIDQFKQPLGRLITLGNMEGLFHAAYPYETAELFMVLVLKYGLIVDSMIIQDDKRYALVNMMLKTLEVKHPELIEPLIFS